MSTTYGNSTSGTFKHPAEIFNLEKLLTVCALMSLLGYFVLATALALACYAFICFVSTPSRLWALQSICAAAVAQEIRFRC